MRYKMMDAIRDISFDRDQKPLEEAIQGNGLSRIFIVLAAVFVWVTAWYWKTSIEVASIWWRSETFAHGLAVWPISIWLIWRKRKELALLTPQPSFGLCSILAVFGGFWFFGVIAGVAAATHFALIVLLVAGFIAALGWKLSRVILFPLLFLLFSIPIGEFLLPLMMSATAHFTVSALRLTGVPVYQEGLYFVVPNGSWSIVQACSGIRYLFASLMIGSLYAYLYYTSFSRRMLFMLVALSVPIVANWLRAYLIVMIGYLSGNKLAAGVDHLVYGWLFFGVVVLLMFWIGGRWEEKTVALPDKQTVAPSAHCRRWVWGVQALVIALFPVALWVFQQPGGDLDTLSMQTPAADEKWAIRPDAVPVYLPHYKGYRARVDQVYVDEAGVTVNLSMRFYASQRKGQEMIVWGNGLVSPEGGNAYVIDSGSTVSAVGLVRYARVVVGSKRFEVRYWYQVNGEVVISDAKVKIMLALDRLLGRLDESAVVMISTPIDEDNSEAAPQRLDDFIRSHIEQIHYVLDETTRSMP